MQLTTLPIVHPGTTPIFTIHTTSTAILTGSTDGVRIWDRTSHDQINIIEIGPTMCARFSRTGMLAVGCGDGTVRIYNKEYQLVYSNKGHEFEVINVVWTEHFLITGGYDGIINIYRIIDGYPLIKRLEHAGPIKGLAMDGEENYLAVQTDKLMIYDRTFVQISENKTYTSGICLEFLASRMCWAPDGRYLAAGLCFNNRHPSVEILEPKLQSEYSLLGHVAPIEVIAFAPKIYTHHKKRYYILSVASQDKSISIWNSMNTRPVLLLRNICTQPIVDMCWDEEVLYICSYDGTVKKMDFTGELGKSENIEDEELPYWEFEVRKLIKGDEIEKKEQEKEKDKKINESITEIIIDSNKIKRIKSKNENINDQKKDKNINDQKKDKLVINEKRNDKKRITPILISKNINSEIEDSILVKENSISFKANSKPITVNKKIIQPSYKFDEHRIEVSSSISVYRGDNLFYSLCYSGLSLFVCSGLYFAFYTGEDVRIYHLESGRLIMPFISGEDIVAMDLLGHKLLLVHGDSLLALYNLERQKCIWKSKLPYGGSVDEISLDKMYCVRCVYCDGRVLYYSREMDVWYNKEGGYNTPYGVSKTSEVLEWNDLVGTNKEYLDVCISHLEYKFVVYENTGNRKGMINIYNKIVHLAKQIKVFNEYWWYKLEFMVDKLIEIGEKRIVVLGLDEMNNNYVMQRFVCEMVDKMK
ncbi:Protein hir1 [Astathelohania contejeani]|uniref:Protein HIR n=1 Tax=Astathelohania contejeani TaxID=164912 RepID=A0ABQ7I0N1_9MICR|nr:Protein hir1 [Thelohania contejeani]